MEIRQLFAPDLKRGFVETLSSLSPVTLDEERLIRIFQSRLRSGVIKTYIALLNGKVVGTATVLFEPKFLHDGAKAAHVEDVAVHKDHQKKGIGKALMEHVEAEARKAGCYKIILDCEDHNVEFYERLGYFRNGNHFRKDL